MTIEKMKDLQDRIKKREDDILKAMKLKKS